LMKKCEYIEGCPIAKYFGDMGWRIFVRRYCKGDYEQCQRRELRQNGEPVPDHLFPWGSSPVSEDAR
jgi:hypothetical protein